VKVNWNQVVQNPFEISQPDHWLLWYWSTSSEWDSGACHSDCC